MKFLCEFILQFLSFCDMLGHKGLERKVKEYVFALTAVNGHDCCIHMLLPGPWILIQFLQIRIQAGKLMRISGDPDPQAWLLRMKDLLSRS